MNNIEFMVLFGFLCVGGMVSGVGMLVNYLKATARIKQDWKSKFYFLGPLILVSFHIYEPEGVTYLKKTHTNIGLFILFIFGAAGVFFLDTQ